MALEDFKAPVLPLAPAQYDVGHFNRLTKILRLYFNQLDSDTPNRAFTYRTNGIIFEPGGLPALQEGQLGWNSAEETLNLGMAYNVTQQIGQETYARVQNNTGVDIPNGTVVGFAGVGVDNTLLVAPYPADGSQPSLYVLGVMTHTLPDMGTKGYCTVWGHVRDLDTTGTPVSETWAQGDILYANPGYAGKLTNIKPTVPNVCVPVAAVLRVSATEGEIFVRPTVEQQQYYGTFDKTSSQTPAAIDTEYRLTFDASTESNGVSIGTPASRIVVVESGLYKFDATLQITSSSSSAKNIWVWFKKNGTAIPNSARLLTVALNGGYTPMSLSQSFALLAADYMELAFAADSTDLSVSTVAATAFAPAAPAVVLSVNQVQL